MTPVLRLENLHKSYGALRVTDGVSLAVYPGECHALIGPNGAGKTTLIHQISGSLKSDSGQLLFDGRDITKLSLPQRSAAGLGRTFQITTLIPQFSVLENVALSAQAKSGSSFRFLKPAARESDLNAQAMSALEQFDLAGCAARTAGELSHGEQRQLAVQLGALPAASTRSILGLPRSRRALLLPTGPLPDARGGARRPRSGGARSRPPPA